MEEAIASSQLEGAITTRDVAKEMLQSGRKPKNISEKMIVNNYLTIKKIVENKNEKLTPQFILDIHKSITNDTLKDKDYEGAFRKNDNVKIVEDVTNEVFYTPPDHILIDPLIEKLCDFANHVNDKQFIHPIIRGIILHFLIGYIHPFADGNGRTARAIFYWYLISKNYWLIEYLSISNSILKARSQYARAFLHTEYDDNDLTYFIKYNIKSIDAALKSLKEYVKRKAEEKKQVFSLIKLDGLNERQALIIKELADDKNKMLTVKQIETKFSISNQTARTDLTNLVDKGFLNSRTVNKKMMFFASEKFDQLVKKIAAKHN
jgi:Fic family protein